MQKFIGNFVMTGTAISPNLPTGLEKWPAFVAPDFVMANVNQKGGVEVSANSSLDSKLNELNVMWNVEPGLYNTYAVVNGYERDMGRGKRSELRRDNANSVPM